MRRKYGFCILCIALFIFSGCAKSNQTENGNSNGNSVSNETDGSQQTEDDKKSDTPVSNDAMSENSETKLLTEEEAKKLALDRVPGASEKDIRKFKMDREDGRAEYEGEIIYDGMEYEFEIDAESGAFTEWEQEVVNH